ncbi:hypothetical protein HOK021_53700 [Streptomyces hygroscopicus]|nr:hypothetical protein HOK021_53700 [Streptomyces hygroscopicus]
MRATTLALCASVAVTVPAAALPHEGPDTPSTGPAPASATTVPPGTGHEPAQGVSEAQVDNAREVQRYWTPERIRAAVPVDAAQPRKPDSKARPGSGLRRKPSLASPLTTCPKGSPQSVCSRSPS